ncbi:MAG: C40 family peptidase [Bacteroidota bacterium]|nr:C40 family peptidase [Bacteroidota bacterium]
MIRNSIVAVVVIFLLASCSSMRPAGSAVNKQAAAPPPASKPTTANNKKADVKFLDQITANPQLANTIPDAKADKNVTVTPVTEITTTANSSSSSENNSALQLKYAALLGTDPAQIQATELFKSIDDWYGTRYLMGGTSKSGIDCSAFVQAIYLSAFGMAIPRTAFEQFKVTNRISATEMKEGDLVFFNTTGGVSHVGIYVGNNKFAHASVAKGVTVSDLFDPYYLRRFLGVGRIEKPLGTR